MSCPLAAALVVSVACAGQPALPAATDRLARSLSIVATKDELGCRAVRGELVVLLRPELGALVLATRELPGAEQVGWIEGSQIRFSLPGTRMRELRAETDAPSPQPMPIWGMAVREVDPPRRAACFALDGMGTPAEERLRARVRELAEEVVVPFHEELSSTGVGPRFDSRTVMLEVQAAGGGWRRVEAREAVPLSLPGDGTRQAYTVVPVIPDPGDRVLLLISTIDRAPGYPEGRPSRMARTLEPGGADVSLGEPPVRIRIREILPPESKPALPGARLPP